MTEPQIEGATEPSAPTFVASDRELIISLLDAVIALSDRLFPEERMEVEVRGKVNGEPSFSYVSSSTLTHWVKR